MTRGPLPTRTLKVLLLFVCLVSAFVFLPAAVGNEVAFPVQRGWTFMQDSGLAATATNLAAPVTRINDQGEELYALQVVSADGTASIIELPAKPHDVVGAPGGLGALVGVFEKTYSLHYLDFATNSLTFSFSPGPRGVEFCDTGDCVVAWGAPSLNHSESHFDVYGLDGERLAQWQFDLPEGSLFGVLGVDSAGEDVIVGVGREVKRLRKVATGFETLWSLVLPEPIDYANSMTWINSDLFSVDYPGGLFRLVDTDGVTVYEATEQSLESLYPAGSEVNVRSLRPVPSSLPGHVVFLRDRAVEDSINYDLETGSSAPLDWTPLPPGETLSYRISRDGRVASIGPTLLRVIPLVSAPE